MQGQARSSGDLAADRRYDYACSSARDGEFAVAENLLVQALEIAPEWPAAWFALGEARESLSDVPGAIEAYEQAAAYDPDGAFGAALNLARLGAREAPASPPAAYVRGLFDQYAGHFERHLVQQLSYRGPAILVAAITRACEVWSRPCTFPTALDLGCGTGLMAAEMQSMCGAIDGVDIAPAMAARSRASGRYRRVVEGDLNGFLESYPASGIDLVTAADVFVYVGDLEDVFARTRRVMARDALFAFTVQVDGSQGFGLGADLRYVHSRSYLEQLADRYGLAVVACDDASIRRDRGLPVPGLALVMVAP
ncbi:MAG: SAM-dependent methyltransferase [Hyphomicrobiales bacterium]|nr:SAM-dependent methyltransferase [Hyphomicrobiales bacterium]